MRYLIAYPLRGELRVKTSLTQTESMIAKCARSRLVWVEPSVLSRLDVNIGDIIEIGVAPLTIAGIVTDIPDRSYRAFIAGPTVILNIADMPKTELIQPGSRITYKYLFAGETEAIETFEAWIKPQINEAQRWYDAKAAQNRLSRILDTAEKFLSLASMLGIVLAAVAVAVASRRYGQRHQSTVSVFKALGCVYFSCQKTLLSALDLTKLFKYRNRFTGWLWFDVAGGKCYCELFIAGRCTVNLCTIFNRDIYRIIVRHCFCYSPDYDASTKLTIKCYSWF